MTHDDLGEVAVTLTSPSGTILTVYDGGDPGETLFDNNIGWNVDFNSGSLYSFYGETTQGTWMLNVVDGVTGNTGTLDSWTMRFNEVWDGEMFVGSDLTVQGTARVRDELRVEYGGSLVFSDTDENSSFNASGDTISIYTEVVGCGGGLSTATTCTTTVCDRAGSYSAPVWFACDGSCTATHPNYTRNSCSNVYIGKLLIDSN